MFSQLFSTSRSTDQLSRPEIPIPRASCGPSNSTEALSRSTPATIRPSTASTASHHATSSVPPAPHAPVIAQSTGGSFRTTSSRQSSHPPTFTPLATAAARVYHADFGAKGAKSGRRGSVSGMIRGNSRSGSWAGDGKDGWAYSGLAGMLSFGYEAGEAATVDPRISGPVDPTSGAVEIPEPAPVVYSLRLADEVGRPIWTFKVPTEGFDYQLDRPFFHVFAGKSRRFGLRFDDDARAEEFGRIVRARTTTTGNRDRSRTFPGAARPFSRAITNASRGSLALDGSRSSSEGSRGSMESAPFSLDAAFVSSSPVDIGPLQSIAPPPQRKGSVDVPAPRITTTTRPAAPTRAVPATPSPTKPSPPSRPTMNRQPSRNPARKRRVRVSMISRPASNTFVHIGHVGIGKEGGIEVSPNMDPLWATVLADCRVARAQSVTGRKGRRASQSSASVLSRASGGSAASPPGSGRSTPAHGYPGRQSPVRDSAPPAPIPPRMPYYRRISSETTTSRSRSL
ncbi:hypothetical protein GGF50DRAFT_119272 [Schizophyllum commune]